MKECRNNTLEFYDSNADTFAASSVNADMSAICDHFLGFLSAGAYIMDLGCGTGRDTKYFHDKGYRVMPIDGSAEMCRIAAEVSGIQPRQMRFEELDFKNVFDGIWACASLLHVEREQLPDIMKRVGQALKPGGIVYLSFKYGHNSGYRGGRYFTDLTEADIPYLFENNPGFELLEYIISKDVRPDHPGEKWLNVYLRKKYFGRVQTNCRENG